MEPLFTLEGLNRLRRYRTLIVVDGFVTGLRLSDISPNDIESIEVVKEPQHRHYMVLEVKVDNSNTYKERSR